MVGLQLSVTFSTNNRRPEKKTETSSDKDQTNIFQPASHTCSCPCLSILIKTVTERVDVNVPTLCFHPGHFVHCPSARLFLSAACRTRTNRKYR